MTELNGVPMNVFKKYKLETMCKARSGAICYVASE